MKHVLDTINEAMRFVESGSDIRAWPEDRKTALHGNLLDAYCELRARAQEPQGPVKVSAVWVAGRDCYDPAYSWADYGVNQDGGPAKDWYPMMFGRSWSGSYKTKESAMSACESHCIAMLAALGISAVIDRTTGETK